MKISVGQTRTKCRQFSPFVDSKAATHRLKKPFTASNFAQMEVRALSSIPIQLRASLWLPCTKTLQPKEKKGCLMGRSAGKHPHHLCHKMRESRYLSKIIFCYSGIPAIVTLNGQFPSFQSLQITWSTKLHPFSSAPRFQQKEVKRESKKRGVINFSFLQQFTWPCTKSLGFILSHTAHSPVLQKTFSHSQ